MCVKRDRASAAKSSRGPDLHYGVVGVTGVQTLVGRFVRGARFVAVRQTFVLCGQATPCASRAAPSAPASLLPTP